MQVSCRVKKQRRRAETAEPKKASLDQKLALTRRRTWQPETETEADARWRRIQVEESCRKGHMRRGTQATGVEREASMFAPAEPLRLTANGSSSRQAD